MSKTKSHAISQDQTIDPSVYLHDSAQLYGRVSIGEESSVWPNVVVRAECHEVSIGRYSNLQDFAMLHIGYGHSTEIGDFCSITHHATVHGAKCTWNIHRSEHLCVY